MNPKKKVFINYRRKDASKLATKLYELLIENSYEVFLDTKYVGNEPWHKKMMSAVAESDVFLALFSGSDSDGQGCFAEEEQWVARTLRKQPIPIIAVKNAAT